MGKRRRKEKYPVVLTSRVNFFSTALYNQGIMAKLDRFYIALAEYSVWYNTKRVHKG